jgi:HlyD family secretion protein
MKNIVILILLLAVVGGVGGWYYGSSDHHGPAFRTVQVERGDLLASINATGTIEPEEVIDIGAQIVGQILSFGHDPRDPDDPDPRFKKDPKYKGRLIDFGSPVEKGTVLAHIDDSIYKAQVDQADAQVKQAEAALISATAEVGVADANEKQAEANLEQLKAKAYQAERDWTRAQKLGPTKALADVDYDTAEATYLTSKAAVAVGVATVAQTKAALEDAKANVAKANASIGAAKATLANAQTNLRYCTITSPVKGVIVDRRVNIGQTVVSSLNAPSLFLLAKDLKRLQVWASVNEADIGNIKPGQAVTFTVDAFPDRVYKGVVAADQPRLNASMTQNVVTYTVVVNTDNSDGSLLPYLTANVQFEVSRHTHVLLVPNAALRWRPTAQQVAPEARDEFVRSQRKRTAPGEKPVASAEKEHHDRGTLWVEDNGFVKPVKVRIGLSDGLQTEIVKGDIQEGAYLVVGEARANTESSTSNPFTPKLFNKKQ